MAKRGKKFQEFVAHAADVNCLNIGKKSRRVFVTGGSDRVVNLWGFDTSNSLLSLSGHTTSVQCVTFDSAEVLVLAGASNGTIKLWDLEEGKSVRTVTGHRSSCTSVEFHPFGEFFASGSVDTDLKIWDIRKKGSIHTYKGHTRGIKTIKFTPDGRWVVTGGEDNIVKLWDLTAGKLLHDFKLHKGMIRSIEFHPHEFLLATGSADRTVKFWDLETFELIGSFGPEVLSWEPMRCHDTVEMGWSSLADLIIYEGKLLGCSFHQSRVGVWIADISLIGPYAIGLSLNKNSLSEPLSTHMENSSFGIIESDTKSNSPLVTGAVDYAVKTTEELEDISIPVSVPRNHVSRETTSSSRAANSNADLLVVMYLAVQVMLRDLDHDSEALSQSIVVEFGPSSGISSNWDRGNSSSKHRQVGTGEKPDTGDASSSSTRYVAEKFERTMPPDRAATVENDKCEELASSSNGNGLVKYVRGVAVPLGKTRSLVERFEKRESFGHSATVSCDRLLQTHDAFINSLKSRLTKLQVVRHFWEFNGINAAVDATVKLPDHSVCIILAPLL
ncbi:hypothetical protein KSP39_PZI006880 [Platanthera zijinensis]|uniref:Katanin p80 subunit C-terminal domain-containing protein n=1 Tax=Platanthera zijinensis TaxID=2320716 RepID=A0AAP0BPS0_9ASPA